MTYPFKFADATEPRLTFGRRRAWGPLSVVEAHATPGRYPGAPMTEHRIIFYRTPGVPTDCACEGVRGVRIQASGDFDMVPGGASGVWEDHLACEMLSVRLAPELLDSAAEALALPGGRAQVAPRIGARDPLVAHVCDALAAELEAPEPAARLYADGLATALATRLLQSFAVRPAAGRQTLSKPQMRRLVEYVEVHIADDLSLEELAGVVGLSVPHFTALFRRTMGQSAHAYVMERRVHRARALLLARRHAITTVALETGFAHPSHMARWMRRLLGVTPSQVLRA